MPTRPRRQRSSRPPGATRPDGELANWWSVHFGTDGVEQLNTAPLLRDARDAKKCVIVSAYLSMDWFGKLLEAVPAECEVRLHLNEGELKRKPALREQLAEEIEHRGSLLRVRL